MWTLLVLLALWFVSMEFYFPVAVVVVLFAAVVAASTLSISGALSRRKARA